MGQAINIIWIKISLRIIQHRFSAAYDDVDQDEGFHDHAVTILLVAWGQFIDHDITLTAETKDIRHVKSMLSFLSYHDWQPFNSKVK